MGKKKTEVCPACWHEDCVCGKPLEERITSHSKGK